MTEANANNLVAVIDADIKAVGESETITKTVLARLSRNLLIYVPDSKDIGRVNRLLDVLTRNNEKVAVFYFQHFLPWKLNKETSRFGEMIKGDANRKAKTDSIDLWLQDEANNIWAWADRNVQIEPRDKNYKAQITSLVDRALTATGPNERFRITARDVINSIVAGGVSLADIMAAIDTANAAKVEAEQAANNNAADVPETEAKPAS